MGVTKTQIMCTKHVLRSLLTTSWGDNLTSAPINNGDSFNHNIFIRSI